MSKPQRLAILAWPGGEDPAGVRTLEDPSRLLEIIGKSTYKGVKQVGVLFEGEVKPGQILHLKQMVQAGASTPVRLLFIPIPPPQDKASEI